MKTLIPIAGVFALLLDSATHGGHRSRADVGADVGGDDGNDVVGTEVVVVWQDDETGEQEKDMMMMAHTMVKRGTRASRMQTMHKNKDRLIQRQRTLFSEDFQAFEMRNHWKHVKEIRRMAKDILAEGHGNEDFENISGQFDETLIPYYESVIQAMKKDQREHKRKGTRGNTRMTRRRHRKQRKGGVQKDFGKLGKPRSPNEGHRRKEEKPYGQDYEKYQQLLLRRIDGDRSNTRGHMGRQGRPMSKLKVGNRSRKGKLPIRMSGIGENLPGMDQHHHKEMRHVTDIQSDDKDEPQSRNKLLFGRRGEASKHAGGQMGTQGSHNKSTISDEDSSRTDNWIARHIKLAIEKMKPDMKRPKHTEMRRRTVEQPGLEEKRPNQIRRILERRVQDDGNTAGGPGKHWRARSIQRGENRGGTSLFNPPRVISINADRQRSMLKSGNMFGQHDQRKPMRRDQEAGAGGLQ
ncbi:uncharacterized protein LOC121366964 [Gigantopelta aegis]|uniref:uncharacterized protein LOC121366964 n=1 Tax=Gigantopelta aegis TaxID=1735272 RepID=UPI001B88782A|nr:uncharacterized protein LOC121366964 [Gigantopelta aegis]